jgi:hypothetical protein
MGPQTRAAMADLGAHVLHAGICAERARKFGRIITGNPSQAVFAAGWLNRLADFIEDGATV